LTIHPVVYQAYRRTLHVLSATNNKR